MSLSLSCACGARFEVEQTFAGQNVSCPECQRSLKAPATPQTLRTSGYAVASLVLALVFMFTVLGTLAAVVLGILALVSISRHRDRVAGTGYAIVGIVLGAVFTGLTLFAVSRVEVFDQVRERIRGEQVDRGGSLEVVREKEGFAITRPSRSWGVDRAHNKEKGSSADLMLVNVAKDAYVEITTEGAEGLTVAQCRDNLVTQYREKPLNEFFGKSSNPATRKFELREQRTLPRVGEAAVEEVLFDIHVNHVPLTFLVRLVKDDDSGRLYVMQAWAGRRNFPNVQPDLRRTLDSFRLLDADDGDKD